MADKTVKAQHPMARPWPESVKKHSGPEQTDMPVYYVTHDLAGNAYGAVVKTTSTGRISSSGMATKSSDGLSLTASRSAKTATGGTTTMLLPVSNMSLLILLAHDPLTGLRAWREAYRAMKPSGQDRIKTCSTSAKS
jgi:hypothetical protein